MHRVLRIFLGATIVASFGLISLDAQDPKPATPAAPAAPAAPQAPGTPAAPQKNWKDAAEYDMYSAVVKETDPKKKIALLSAWKEKYPATDYKLERLQLYLNAYQQAGDLHKLVETLNEMLDLNPKDTLAMGAIMYYVMLPAYEAAPAAGTLDTADKVANSALANLDNKPANVKDEDWVKGRKQLEALAHQTLGWVAMNRKDAPKAEAEFVKSLLIDPNQGQVDYWLAGVLRSEKAPDKVSQALFFYARAATYDGQGALTPEGRKQLDDYLHKAYNSYHGQDDGELDKLKTLAKSQPMPPDNFKIETATEIATKKEEEFKKTNPQLAMWMSLKKELTGPNGQQFFDTMKGADVPGGAKIGEIPVTEFKGTIISAKPAVRSKELVIGIADSKTPEVTLKLDQPLTGKPEIGSEVGFDGIPAGFVADPFMVTFDVEKAKLKGLKMDAAPARPPMKKAAPKKKAA